MGLPEGINSRFSLVLEFFILLSSTLDTKGVLRLRKVLMQRA